MADSHNVRLDSAPVLARLGEIARQIDDLSPAMLAIGELLTESTKQRFSTSTAPDGSKWAPNAPATVLARLNQIKGAYTKAGKLSKKGATVAMSKKPLVASGLLQDSFSYQLTGGGQGVEIGTNRFANEWEGGTALFHWGSRDGSIPARPIVGLSAGDESAVLDILDTFLWSPLGGS